jgi:NitT/TauT family transport system permease protein
VLNAIERKAVDPALEALDLYFARRHTAVSGPPKGPARQWVLRVLAVLGLAGVAYAVVRMCLMLATITGPDLGGIFRGAGATFLRVEFTLVLAGLWTIPVGVYVGLRPRMAAVAQPIAQVAASVPATALFPIVLLALIRVGGGLGIGSFVLLLLGTQGGLRRVPHEPGGTLEEALPTGNFPLSGDGIRHRLRRRVECEHRGRIFEDSGQDVLDRGARRGD